MAEEKDDKAAPVDVKKSKLPLLIGSALGAIILLGGGLYVFNRISNQEKQEVVDRYVEFNVPENMYQLKDGSYLSLGFHIVVAESKLKILTDIVTGSEAGRLPDGINMLLGNKSREDLINGSHKREAFAQEIKKVLEERVLQEYNKKQKSPQDMIEIRKILISKFVTQTG